MAQTSSCLESKVFYFFFILISLVEREHSINYQEQKNLRDCEQILWNENTSLRDPQNLHL